MTAEQEKIGIKLPFRRLEALFDRLPKENSRHRDERVLELEDKTKVEVGISRPFPGSSSINYYSVGINPFGRSEDVRNPDRQIFRFEIDDTNYVKITKAPRVDIEIGGTKFSQLDLPSLTPTVSRQENLAVGSFLVDWVEKIIGENKYSKPPITASIFR